MKKNLDIVVVGELNVDLILTGLPSLPELGSCTLSEDMHFTLGSASAIFAANIARLGLDVGFVGKIGDDEFGDFILRMLEDRNVDISHIIRDKTAKTGICVSLSFPDNYAMASYAGVRENLTFSDVSMDYLAKAGHLHMSSYYLQTGMQKGCTALFMEAGKRGLTTSLDPDSDPSGRWDESIFEVLNYVDIFLPNAKEACRICRCSSIEQALEILGGIVNIAVIKNAEHGVWVKSGNKIIQTKIFPVDVRDTTGAGDSFNSGFIYQYLKGSALEDCIVWGTACAAISTTKAGGTTAFPNRRQLESFLAERKSEISHLMEIRHDRN